MSWLGGKAAVRRLAVVLLTRVAPGVLVSIVAGLVTIGAVDREQVRRLCVSLLNNPALSQPHNPTLGWSPSLLEGQGSE